MTQPPISAQSVPARPLAGLTYWRQVFGCQMNVSDGERVSGMLEAAGAIPVSTLEEADIAVFLTCCVREKADTRLTGQVASLKNVPAAHPELTSRIVCVGGCIGQRDGERLRDVLGHVDVVFGTHNLGRLVDLVTERLESGSPVCETLESGEGQGSFADLPMKRDASWHAWVPIMTGCDNFCTYCIVPYVRGRETSRALESIATELEGLAGQGVREVTLLGQNVNSYGRDRYGEPRFPEVLELAATCGVDRVRFVTSHPKDLSPETIEVMASHDTVMPQLHLPLQSGSDRILEAMNRTYDSARYLSLVGDLRRAMPDLALSTDVIVGFPGETEEDFEDTCRVVSEVGYSQAFTFIYSKRAGTPAATMPGQLDSDVVQERFDRLVAIVQESAHRENQKELGQVVDVLVEGTSKRDANMICGRSPKNQTVHAPIPEGTDVSELVGRVVGVRVEEARTWYLAGEIA